MSIISKTVIRCKCLLPILGLVLTLPSPQAGAADTPAKCRYANISTLPVKFDGSHPLVDGKIDGKKATLLVDTGAYTTSLFAHAGEKLNLNLMHMNGSDVGIGGESQKYYVHVDDFQFGPASGKNIYLPVIASYAAGVSQDGLLGAEFLLHTDVELNLAERYLKFFRPSDCRDTHLAYWDSNADSVEMRSLPSIDEPSPEIDVFVNGQKLRAVVDTGATTSLIDLRAAARAGVTPDAPGVQKNDGKMGGIGGKDIQTWVAPFSEIRIGEETIKNVKIAIGNLWGNVQSSGARSEFMAHGHEMLLGSDFFRAHRVLFAVSQRRLYFTYLGGNVFGAGAAPDFDWIKQEAERGNADSQLKLAYAYRSGTGMEADGEKALEWARRAADGGNAGAQQLLGFMYENGEGTARDLAAAREFYQKAATAGNAPAQADLGRMYEHGRGGPKDPALAMSWYRKAAENGNGWAQMRLGILLAAGKVVPKDEKAADEWLDKAMLNRTVQDYWNMGRTLYLHGMYGRSLGSLDAAIAGDASNPYYPLWRYLAQARNADAASGISRLAAESRSAWKDGAWPGRIADFFLGKATEAELLAQAKAATGEKARGQICEANFYIAEKYLVDGASEKARSFLKPAAAECPANFVEYIGALAELDHLNER